MTSHKDTVLPDSTRSQYLRYRNWSIGGFCVGIIPVICFIALWLQGSSDQISLPIIMIGAMLTALGFFVAACSYLDGVRPGHRNHM